MALQLHYRRFYKKCCQQGDLMLDEDIGETFIMFGIAAFLGKRVCISGPRLNLVIMAVAGAEGATCPHSRTANTSQNILMSSYENKKKSPDSLGAKKKSNLMPPLSSQDPDKVKIEDISARNRRNCEKHAFREGGGTQQTSESGTPLLIYMVQKVLRKMRRLETRSPFLMAIIGPDFGRVTSFAACWRSPAAQKTCTRIFQRT